MKKGKSVNTPANVDLLASHLKFTLGLPLLKRALWDVLRMVSAICVHYRDWDTLETLYTWLMRDQGHRHEAGLRCGSSHSQVLPSFVVALPKKTKQIRIQAEISGKPVNYSKLFFYLCMILQRCCQKCCLSQTNCYHGPHSFASAIKVISEDISLSLLVRFFITSVFHFHAFH